METPVKRNNKRKHGRKLFKNIAIGAFDQLAKLPFVQNKRISSNVWYELALQRYNIDSEIDASYFRRLLLASDSKISNDISVSNEHGYYNKSPRKCHRNVLDSEHKFLKAMVEMIKSGDVHHDDEEEVNDD